MVKKNKSSFDGTLFGGKRQRVEHRYRMPLKLLVESDAVKVERYAGHVLSKEAILRIFGYSPNTYINDTRIVRNKLVRKMKDGKYKVVNPNERTAKR
jgi:hypothetical protein